jgi:hypothetical protein
MNGEDVKGNGRSQRHVIRWCKVLAELQLAIPAALARIDSHQNVFPRLSAFTNGAQHTTTDFYGYKMIGATTNAMLQWKNRMVFKQ